MPGVQRKKASHRVRGDKVARINMVPLRTGELFYLQTLLLHCAAQSFVDLCTIDGHLFPSYHEAARDLSLFHDQNEGILAMQEAVECLRTPSQLRFLFAQIILEGYPAMPLWMQFRVPLSEDHPMFFINENLAFDATLQMIAVHLSNAGKTLDNYGLPNPSIIIPDIANEITFLRHHRDDFSNQFEQLQAQLNDEQRHVFDFIYDHIADENNSTHQFFIEGRPGRGKTFLIQTLLSRYRAEVHIILIVGTSALSAIAYPRSRTAHYMFGIPVTEDNVELHSKIGTFSSRADLIQAATAIIWDELPMANKAAWECVHHLCCTLRRNSLPFGGIPFVGIGDF